jgi:hypothetical protein
MARNEYGSMGPQHTAPNPSQTNGANPPRIPPSQAAVVGHNESAFDKAQIEHKQALFAGRLRAERERIP